MGLFSRFMMVLRSNLNALLGRAEDPTKILEQTLLDMEHAYRRAKDQVAHSIADQKRLEKSLADQQSEAKRWQDRAVLAVEKGDDALAKEALRKKNEHTRFAASLEEQLAAHQGNVAMLKDGLRELESKIEELKRKRTILASRQRQAEAQDQIYKSIEGIRGAGAMDTVKRMEDKVDQMVALSDARRELSTEARGGQIEQQFRALEAGGGAEVERELLELKQRLQIEHKK
ncbi:MAG TPA: PspA/IM30 family protein [bacterium]